MNSRGIPNASDENGTGAANDPTQKQNLAGFIQEPRFHQTKEIRRAGEQTSPQVARAVGLPRKLRDEGGGLISGSRSIRRFLFQGPGRPGGKVKTDANSVHGAQAGQIR